MRLGQLARKLKRKPQEIVSYLKDHHNEDISVHPNAKIKEEFIEELIGYFKENLEEGQEDINASLSPEDNESTNLNKESTPREIGESTDQNEKSPKELKNNPALVSPLEALEDTEDNINSASTNDTEEDQEVKLNIVDGTIKAPKIEVKGVKVVGKVEIPEPKVTEEESTENNTDSSEGGNTANEKEKKSLKKGANKKRKKSAKRKRKEELSFEEKKKLELDRYEKEKQRKLEIEKQKKKRHYEDQVLKKVKHQNKSKKRKSKHATNQTAEKPIHKPTTLWGKFLRWLNT